MSSKKWINYERCFIFRVIFVHHYYFLLYQWFDGEEDEEEGGEEEGEEEQEEDYDDHEVELDQSDTEVTGHPVSSEIEGDENSTNFTKIMKTTCDVSKNLKSP